MFNQSNWKKFLIVTDVWISRTNWGIRVLLILRMSTLILKQLSAIDAWAIISFSIHDWLDRFSCNRLLFLSVVGSLPIKAIEANLSCHLPHRWRWERWIYIVFLMVFAHRWMQQIQQEFELGSSRSDSEPISHTTNLSF